MRLHRFYIKNKIENESFEITDTDLLYQWQKVFRFKVGDEAIIFDGTGFEFFVSFENISRSSATFTVIEKKEVKDEIKTELNIFQSIIKKDNFEFVVQKCTEIGASSFHPVLSERSEKKDLNIERLEKIAKEASEQSGRVTVPQIFEPKNLKEVLKDFDGKIFVLDFEGKNVSEVDILGKVGILVGPEGGWSDTERSWFKEQNIVSLTLGKQVLRAETASISASALILLEK
jgi:16S rRNA (uracil1498-N3)-methyltransferase